MQIFLKLRRKALGLYTSNHFHTHSCIQTHTIMAAVPTSINTGTAVLVCLIRTDKVTCCPVGHLRGSPLHGHTAIYSPQWSSYFPTPFCSPSLPVCLQVSTSY